MTTRWIFGAMVVVGALAAGCGASMRSVTGERIDCATNDVVIQHAHDEVDSESWVASCRGRTREYLCAHEAKGDDDSPIVCTPMTNHN